MYQIIAKLFWFLTAIAMWCATTTVVGAQVTSGAKIDGRTVTQGDITTDSFELCEGADANDVDCPEFDLTRTSAANPGGDAHGIPWFAVIHIDAIGTCTGNVAVRHYPISDTGSPFKRVLGTLTIGGTEELQVDGPFLDRFLDVDLTNLAVCVAGEFDVAIQLRYLKRR